LVRFLDSLKAIEDLYTDLGFVVVVIGVGKEFDDKVVVGTVFVGVLAGILAGGLAEVLAGELVEVFVEKIVD